MKHDVNFRRFVDNYLFSWKSSPLFLVYRELLSWICVELCQMLFQHLLILSYDFSSLTSWCDELHWFSNVEPSLHICNKSYLVVVYSSFYTLLNSFFFFLAVLGLCCCMGFSLVAPSGGLFSSCSAQASCCGGFSCCGARALGHSGFSSGDFWDLERRLRSCGAQA